MLAIRLQRTGRTGHTQFRVIVQDRRAHPKSGRIVAYVGSYNPHSKAATIDKDKISTYLSNGAVPSDRVARLLTKEGMKLPDWYKESAPKEKAVRNPDKRRSTRPEGAPEPVVESPAEETPAETPAETTEAPVTETEAEQPKNEEKAEEPVTEPAAEEPAAEPTEAPTEAEADAESPAAEATEK